MYLFLSTHTPIGKVWIYRLLFVCLCVCTVTDFSGEDKASGFKFCTVVQERVLGRESPILWNFASTETQNRTNRLPTRKQRSRWEDVL